MPLASPHWKTKSGVTTYRVECTTKLHDAGILDVAEGLRVQPPGQLWDSIVERWGTPVRLLCDRFRLGELQDVVQGACRYGTQGNQMV